MHWRKLDRSGPGEDPGGWRGWTKARILIVPLVGEVTIKRRENRDPMILYAECNPGYDLLAQEAFRKAQVPFDVRLVSDCNELLQYLSECGDCSTKNAPCPDVILLNLRIFGQIGIAGLAYIKSNPLFWDVSTIVLTNSKAEAEAVRSYRLRAVAYARRPRTVSRLIRIMRAAQAVADDQACPTGEIR